MERLAGKVAIVTGGGGGLGAGISKRLAEAGARIVVSDITAETAQRVADELADAGHETFAVVTDVCDAEQCAQLRDSALERFGQVDILVCNAGVDGLPKGDPPPAPLLENITDEEWDVVMDVNVKGVFKTVQAFTPYFKERRSGRVVIISSVAGRQGLEFLVPYAASKAAAISLGQSIALQLAPFHVNVNTICPGIIWTPMWERLATYLSQANPNLKDNSPEEVFGGVVQQMIPFGTPQVAEDIGDSVVFLSSDAAKEITGQALNVCGGIRLN